MKIDRDKAGVVLQQMVDHPSLSLAELHNKVPNFPSPSLVLRWVRDDMDFRECFNAFEEERLELRNGYNHALGEAMCALIATESLSLLDLHRKYDWFPSPTQFLQLLARHPDLRQMYMLARIIKADHLAHEGMSILDQADDCLGKDSIPILM